MRRVLNSLLELNKELDKEDYTFKTFYYKNYKFRFQKYKQNGKLKWI